MNRAILTFILAFCTVLSVNAQTKTEGKDINNVKTDKHINIPGTRLYIIPPAGFKVATSFMGLEKGKSCSLQVFDLVGGDFYTNAATFSKKAFEKLGAKVLDYKEFKINGFPAKYVFMQSTVDVKNINFVFGDNTFSTMVAATFPSIDDKTAEQLQHAIKTIYYDKNLKNDPFATAAFTLNDSKSVFKFAKSSAGLFMYSIGGVDKQSYDNEPFIIVTTLPKDQSTTVKAVSEALVSGLERNGLTDKELKNISTKAVNGQPAYETEVYCKMEGKNSLIYQLVVAGKDKIVAIQGIAKSDFDRYLKEFKNLARTIKMK